MKAFATLVLALAVANVRSQVCLTRPGAELTQDARSAQICGQRNSRTIVTLNCNWHDYRFDLEVQPSRTDNIRNVEVETSAARSRSGVEEMRALAGNEPELARAQCTNGDTSPRLVSIPFVSAAGQPQVRMEIVDGQLYYKTSVTLRESYFIDPQCDRYRFLDTPIELSCCADPLATPPAEVVPPLHQYCDIDTCHVVPPADCECPVIQDPQTGDWQYHVTCESRTDLSNYPNVATQLVNLHFFPAVAFPPRQFNPTLPVIQDTALVPLPEHLEVEHPARQFLPRRVTKLNHFVFHQFPESQTAISARVEYCIVNRPSAPLVPANLNSFPDCVTPISTSG